MSWYNYSNKICGTSCKYNNKVCVIQWNELDCYNVTCIDHHCPL